MTLPELYADLYSTTLSGSITSGATSLTVADTLPAALAAAGQFRAVIDVGSGIQELVLVTAVSGTGNKTWTITRGDGIPATTPAAHGSGAGVQVVLTAASLENLPASTTGAGALAATATRTSTLAAPALRDFISVMDFGAVGDAKIVSDGAITAGTNTLTSATATWKANQQVNVAGAGPGIGGVGGAWVTLAGWVSPGYVSGTSVSLVTTQGGATPLNATHTVSGAKVTFGTDDSAAVQNAMNAVTAATFNNDQGGYVLMPSGFSFLIGNVNPKDHITLQAYGATIFANQISGNAVFEGPTLIAQFYLLGGNFVGLGTEPANVMVFNTLSGGPSADIVVGDLYVTNWATCVLYYRNFTRARALNNTLINCTTLGYANSAYNAINFVLDSSGGNPVVQHCWAIGNYVDNTVSQCIAVVQAGGNTNVSQIKAIITDNNCHLANVGGYGTAGGGAIALEWSSAAAGAQDSEFIIANNVCEVASSSNSDAWGISAYDFSSAGDPLFVSRVIIAGNILNSAQGALQVGCSDAIVKGNYVRGGGSLQNAVQVGYGSSNLSLTGTTAGSSNQVTSVTGTQTFVANGCPVTGTNIPAGTFIVSGAGTATWTLSANATGTNAGLTVYPQDKRIIFEGNLITASASIGGWVPVWIEQLRDSKFINNRVYCEGAGTAQCVLVAKCGWMEICGNRIDLASTHALELSETHDSTIADNYIYNPSVNAAGSYGMYIHDVSGSSTGTAFRVTRNTIIDDRSSHRMANGIDVSTNTNSLAEVTYNYVSGATGTLINGTCAAKYGNRFSSGAVNGRATLAAGTVTVSTAEVQTADSILLTSVVTGGTAGFLNVGAIVAGTSFVIHSSNAADTSTVYWEIRH